jgi:hypothetical protein
VVVEVVVAAAVEVGSEEGATLAAAVEVESEEGATLAAALP